MSHIKDNPFPKLPISIVWVRLKLSSRSNSNMRRENDSVGKRKPGYTTHDRDWTSRDNPTRVWDASTQPPQHPGRIFPPSPAPPQTQHPISSDPEVLHLTHTATELGPVETLPPTLCIPGCSCSFPAFPPDISAIELGPKVPPCSCRNAPGVQRNINQTQLLSAVTA